MAKMKITIKNKLRLRQVPDNLKDMLVERLKLPNPKYQEALKHGYWTGNIPKYIVNFTVLPDESILIPRGMYRPLLGLCDSLGIKTEIEDQRTLFKQNYDIDSSAIKLRPYQSEAIHNLITRGDEGLLVSKAGSGKTVMGLCLVPLLGQPTLWLTHTTPLINQVLDRIGGFLPSLKEDDIGYIGSSKKWKIGNVITVAMIQTLVRRPEELATLSNKFGLVILDEAHHAPATTFTYVLNEFSSKYMYGLTATPTRRDGLEDLMFQTIGEVNAFVTMDEIVDYGGIIVPTVIKKDVKSPQIITTDNFSKIIKALVYDNHRNNLIVKDVVGEAEKGHICIVVTERKVHAEMLHEMIRQKWPRTAIATGNYTKKYVEEQIGKLSSKEVTVLIATSALLGEGFDFAPLDRCFLGLPFRNEAKIEQIIGRIQRPAPGKTDAVLYDYVDNHGLLQHQFYNTGSKGCRYDVYSSLGANVYQG